MVTKGPLGQGGAFRLLALCYKHINRKCSEEAGFGRYLFLLLFVVCGFGVFHENDKI